MAFKVSVDTGAESTYAKVLHRKLRRKCGKGGKYRAVISDELILIRTSKPHSGHAVVVKGKQRRAIF